jgi:4-hydroxy-tetrahydrodipicolinate reductase
MKIALVGYGKMGKLIAQLAPQFDCEVALTLDELNNANGAGMTPRNFQGIDVAIEFSTPDAALENIECLAALGVNTVVGSTGWFGEMDRARKAVKMHGTGLVWSANFSIGVNVFQRAVAETARLLKDQMAYEAWAWEIHHSAKKDAPSGTLIKLVDAMREAGYERTIDQAASRAGAHPGTHEIGFDSAADTITLRHTARSREGFARGALMAARWVDGKKGFYEFREILFDGIL